MSGLSPPPAALPANITRIVLTGFMGAGKTTVGTRLAARLGWRFLDSDRCIESRAGVTIAEIFSLQGEAAFRRLESAAIREAAAARHLVLALGGGALETPANRDFLASLENSLVVFLDAPLEALIDRCLAHQGGPVRPIFADRERLAERWRSRLPWYRQAHLVVDTLHQPPEAVVDSILSAIRGSTVGSPILEAQPGGRP